MNHIVFLHQERTCISFYDPISILMDEFLEIQSHPWHDFIFIFKQHYLQAIFDLVYH